MAGPAFLDKIKAEVSSQQATSAESAPVHQTGAPDVPMQAPRPAFLDSIKRQVAETQLGSAAQAGRQMELDATVHPTQGVTPPGKVPVNPMAARAAEGFAFQPEDAPATLLDRTARLQLEQEMALATRMGFEALGSKGGGAAVSRLGRAGLRKLGSNRAVQAFGRAIGTGAGSLAAEGLDPSGDPWGTARNAALLNGAVDGIAGAYYGAKDAILSAPLTPGARQTRRLLGDEYLPSAGRLSSSRAIDTAENVAENALFGGRVEARNTRSIGRARQLLYDYTNKFLKGAKKQEVDQLVIDTLSGADETFRATADKLYGKVDEIAGVEIPTDGLVKIRNQLVAEHANMPRDDGMKRLIDGIDRLLGVPDDISGLDNGVILNPAQPRPRWSRQGTPGSNGQGVTSPPYAETAPTGAGGAPDLSRPVQTWTEATAGGRGQWVTGPPDARSTISFSEASRLRSLALRTARSSSDNFPGQLEGAANLISGQVGKDIDTVGGGLAGSSLDAFQYYRLANQFWKDGAEAFNSQIMRAVANARPDDVFKLVMAPNSPKQIQIFRQLTLGGVGASEDTAAGIRQSAQRTLRDPAASQIAKEIAQQRLDGLAAGEKAWSTFKGQLLANVLREADQAAGIATQGAKGTRTIIASQALDRFRGLGDEMLREIFPRQAERTHFERLIRAMEMPQAGTGLGVGRLAIQLQQASAITTAGAGIAISIYSGSPEAGAAGIGTGALILLSPAAIGRLVTSDRFVKALFSARSARLGTEASRRAWAQLATIAASNGGTIVRADGSVVNPKVVTQQQQRFGETADAAGFGR